MEKRLDNCDNCGELTIFDFVFTYVEEIEFQGEIINHEKMTGSFPLCKKCYKKHPYKYHNGALKERIPRKEKETTIAEILASIKVK
jgi:hypothetical protein